MQLPYPAKKFRNSHVDKASSLKWTFKLTCNQGDHKQYYMLYLAFYLIL
jgi:hypothetical protein